MSIIVKKKLMHIRDVDKILKKPPMNNLLSQNECKELYASPKPYAFLIKLLAAKLALMQALGKKQSMEILKDIEISRTVQGRPYFLYKNAALAYMLKHRIFCHLSLSGYADYVIAFVIVEIVSFQKVI